MSAQGFSYCYFHKTDLRIMSDCIGFDILEKKGGRGGCPSTPIIFRFFSFEAIPLHVCVDSG